MIHDWQYFLAPGVALIISKIGKVITHYEGKGKAIGFKDALLRSGGMPSDHSAIVVSITTIIGLTQGLQSYPFAICAVFAAIVLYDSCHVRLSVGLQGEALKKIVSPKQSTSFPINHGHRLEEVVIGALVGVFAGVAVFFLS